MSAIQSPSLHRASRRSTQRHVTVIGAGIVGLTVARELLRRDPGTRVAVIDRDADVSLHQTRRNSGVVHAGLYYRPGSLKARLCKRGHSLVLAYCRQHQIPVAAVGKLIVARREDEIPSLRIVFERARENNVEGIRLLSSTHDILRIEPTLSPAVAQAVYSPVTAVVDWHAVATSVAREIDDRVDFLFRCAPTSLSTCSSSLPSSHSRDKRLELHLVQNPNERQGREDGRQSHQFSIVTDRVVSCAGVNADRVAHALGGAWTPRIVPVRGEYFTLRTDLEEWKKPRTNIYPVPPLTKTLSSSAPPFLGIHFTPRYHGGATKSQILVGPNAVPALGRDAYSWSLRDARVRDVLDMLSYRGTWRLLARHGGFAAKEVYKSLLNPAATIKEAIDYVPALTQEDFVAPCAQTSGIRAQAVSSEGALIDDFVFESVYDGRVLHVRNAPSPAATSSFAIAEMIVDRIKA